VVTIAASTGEPTQMRVKHSIGFMIVLLGLGLVLVSDPQAAVGLRVTAVSGSQTHGGTITLTGSGFGTKSSAAPMKYDDFQNLANGQDPSGDGWNTAGHFKPVASNARVRPGTPFVRNLRAHFNGTVPFSQEGDASNFSLVGRSFPKAYVDFWMYADSTSIGGRKPQNIKIFRLHQDGTGDPNAYWSTTVVPGGGGDSNCAAADGTTSQDWAGCAPSNLSLNGNIPNNAFPGTEFWDKWHHFQVMAAAGSNGAANGTWVLYVDGRLRYNRPGNIALTRSGYDHWAEIWLGNYIRSEEWDGDAYFMWESVYVDNSWARVEIGNNPVYSACTLRETQVPTSWSDGSVSVRVNRGQFPSLSGAYVFVIDEQGNISPGFPLSGGGGTGGGTTPAAPAGVRIVSS